MKHRLWRILRIISLVAIMFLVQSGVALAVDYYLSIKVSSAEGTSDHAPLAIVSDVGNKKLAELGYISDTGLDTRVTYAGSELKHMVAEDKLAFVAPEVKGGIDYSYNYTMGNEALDSFSIIPGYDGYVTVADDAALELGNNFEIEQKGYVDTSSGSDKNLVYKQDAFRSYVSGDEEITTEIPLGTTTTFYPDPNVESTSVDGYVKDTGNNMVWANLIAEPGSGGSDSGNIDRVVLIETYSGTTDNWSELYRGIFLFDTSSIPDGATILSATFSIYGYNKSNTLSGTAPDLNVYSSAPASDTALVAGDFDSLGSTAFSDTPITYANYDTTGYNSFAFNSSGIAAIDKTGITKLGVKNANYDAAAVAPTWSSNTAGQFYCYFADETGTTKDPKLEVTYTTGTLEVTATGVSSGEHTVKTTADGVDLKIYIDGAEEDSVALGSASVPDNDNSWVLVQGNSMPWAEYYKHTVGESLIAWYQPNDMISGTTLSDREGTAQDGIITWGSLPAGITTTTESLHIMNLQEIDPEVEEGAYLELFEEVPPQPEGFYAEGQYDVLPGSEAISELVTAGQIPLKLFWVPVIFAIAIFAGLFIYSKTYNILAVAIAGGVVIGLFCAIGMLPYWVIVPYAIMSATMCVSEKTYGF